MEPRPGEIQRVPLLACPDDLDFSGTLVIAEVSSTEAEVVWERLGMDITHSLEPEEVGREVDWFEIPALRFPRAQYLECVNSFRAIQSIH